MHTTEWQGGCLTCLVRHQFTAANDTHNPVPLNDLLVELISCLEAQLAERGLKTPREWKTAREKRELSGNIMSCIGK